MYFVILYGLCGGGRAKSYFVSVINVIIIVVIQKL